MRSAIYPRRAAAILGQDRSGEKYKPRTDTDQDSFFAAWCRQCQRDKAMRDGCDIDECDDNERCDIIASTQRYDVDDAAYPQQWQIGKDGQPCRSTEAFAAWWGFRGDDREAGIAEEAWRAAVEYVTGGHFSTAVSAEK